MIQLLILFQLTFRDHRQGIPDSPQTLQIGLEQLEHFGGQRVIHRLVLKLPAKLLLDYRRHVISHLEVLQQLNLWGDSFTKGPFKVVF